jgi:HK97 family phage portal protein
MVEACISAYAQTIAMCAGDHWRTLPNGGRERVTTSALSRILKHPNDYQSFSDVLLNLVRNLYANGEGFAVLLRNNRTEVAELHLVRQGKALIAEDGSIFYQLQGNEVLEKRVSLANPVPARDVLHVRLHTPRHPLKGESPILSVALDIAMSGAMLDQQIIFYLNQAKPSVILSTDERLTGEQTVELRRLWDLQTKGENQGGTPMLGWGMKAQVVTTTAQDGQIADLLKMSEQNVALAFRMPLQVLGVGGTPFASTEALMQSWIASGLGFALNHIEEAFGVAFGLSGMPTEYVEFDTGALLRSAWRDRIEALARGVISGIYAPDEARADQGLPAVPGGFGVEPRVQAQVVPLSAWSQAQPKTPVPDSALASPSMPVKEDDEEDDADTRMLTLLTTIDHIGSEHAALAQIRYDQ